MTQNKRTVGTYMEGFRTTDRQEILSCVTNDVEWILPGAFHIRGKDAFNSHIVDDGFAARPEIVVNRMLEADDVVVAEGAVRTERSDGTVLDLVFCDVFEMQGGQIRRLTSYLMQTPAPTA